jgi:hypothetical protein
MSDQPMTEQTSAVPNDCQLVTLLHQEDWIRELASKQKRREALVLHGWSLSAHFRALCHRFKLNNFEDGETPDFVLIGDGRVAVEVTRIVASKKAIYDESVHHPQGAYTSTLRRAKPTRQFHQLIEAGSPPDTSLVRPHFESSGDLEADYYGLATERLTAKAKSVNQYARLYDHTVILLSDEMSEFRAVIEQRLSQLYVIRGSIEFPPNSEVVLVSCESAWSAVVREISKLVALRC